MKPELNRLMRLRDDLVKATAGVCGVEAVSITKNDRGDFALAVHVSEAVFEKAVIPKRFGGLDIVKQRSSTIHPQ
jgi:hypothetical protein